MTPTTSISRRATSADVPLRIGTLSKALGAYGGYLCASQPVIDLIRNRARTLIYSTGLPPAIVAAAIAALDLIEREPDRLALPLAKAQAFTRAAGLPQAQSAIVPVVIGEASAALAASQLLEAEGYLAVAIRPPTVPEGTARLRLSFSAAHPDAEIARLADIVRTRILAQRMSAIFITATGTDIGKTFVTAGLIRHLRASGREVDALKPVMTGFDPAHPEASDAGVLLAALGRPVTAAEIARISPWRFSAPLSPDMAARRERRDHRFQRADGVLRWRCCARQGHTADRRHRRRHGAARRPAHRAGLDGGAHMPGRSGHRQLSRQPQPRA